MGKPKIDCAALFHERMTTLLCNSTLQKGWIDEGYKRIEGDIIREEYNAHIEILFRPHEFKKYVPIVFCDEAWITRRLDWHCFRAKGAIDGWDDRDRLCWIHPREWSQAHNYQLKRLPLVIEEGSTWLSNNVSKLLDRHWVGHELGLTRWRPEWGGWGHGNVGTHEFIRELQQQGHPQNWEIQEKLWKQN